MLEPIHAITYLLSAFIIIGRCGWMFRKQLMGYSPNITHILFFSRRNYRIYYVIYVIWIYIYIHICIWYDHINAPACSMYIVESKTGPKSVPITGFGANVIVLLTWLWYKFAEPSFLFSYIVVVWFYTSWWYHFILALIMRFFALWYVLFLLRYIMVAWW